MGKNHPGTKLVSGAKLEEKRLKTQSKEKEKNQKVAEKKRKKERIKREKYRAEFIQKWRSRGYSFLNSWYTKSAAVLVLSIFAFLVLVVLLLLFLAGTAVAEENPISPSPQTNSSVSTLFILGDSSASCGSNDFISKSFLHDRPFSYTCAGFQTSLLPDLIGDNGFVDSYSDGMSEIMNSPEP